MIRDPETGHLLLFIETPDEKSVQEPAPLRPAAPRGHPRRGAGPAARARRHRGPGPARQLGSRDRLGGARGPRGQRVLHPAVRGRAGGLSLRRTPHPPSAGQADHVGGGGDTSAHACHRVAGVGAGHGGRPRVPRLADDPGPADLRRRAPIAVPLGPGARRGGARRRSRSAPRRTPRRPGAGWRPSRRAPASPPRRCVPTPGCSSTGAPAARSAGPRWPASAGWSRSTAPSAVERCVRPGGPPDRSSARPSTGMGRFAAIEATPGSRAFHADPDWEHAVGPMQFLPESWRPGPPTATGTAPPTRDDLDDAAATAARYLCASGGDLATGGGWQAAILSYNHAAGVRRRSPRRGHGVRRPQRVTRAPTAPSVARIGARRTIP